MIHLFFHPVKAQSTFCALALRLHAPCTNCRFLGELVGCAGSELNELQQVKGPQWTRELRDEQLLRGPSSYRPLVHLAPLQSSAKVLIYRVPQDPFLRCLGPVWSAKEMLILLDGVSRVYNIISTEDTNCSHTRWLHLFHDTFSQRKDRDKLGSILILHSCSQPSQAQIQRWLTL